MASKSDGIHKNDNNFSTEQSKSLTEWRTHQGIANTNKLEHVTTLGGINQRIASK